MFPALFPYIMHHSDLAVFNASVPGAVGIGRGGDTSERRGRRLLRESWASVCLLERVPEERSGRQCAEGGNKAAARTPSPRPVHRHQRSRLTGSVTEEKMSETIVTVQKWGKAESHCSHHRFTTARFWCFIFQCFNQFKKKYFHFIKQIK